MQVKIEEIQDKGLELDEPLPRSVFEHAFDGTVGFALKEASKLKASFKKLAGRVLLKGAFSATVTAPCKRCVKDVTLSLPVRFESSTPCATYVRT